jgi:hypothetical protein
MMVLRALNSSDDAKTLSASYPREGWRDLFEQF